MNFNTEFKSFVNKPVIEQEFEMLRCQFPDEYTEDLENSLIITLNFTDFNELYDLRPNYKEDFYKYFYERGWSDILVLRIEDKTEELFDFEITLNGYYDYLEKIHCYDITDVDMLKVLNLNHLNLFQQIMIFLDSLGVEHSNIGKDLIIYHPKETYTLRKEQERMYIMDYAMRIYNFRQGTLEEIKSYLFPELMRKELLTKLT